MYDGQFFIVIFCTFQFDISNFNKISFRIIFQFQFNLQKMNTKSLCQLPSHSSFRTRIFSYTNNWLLYQSSLTQLKLLHFNNDTSINKQFSIQLGPQFIKNATIVYNSQQKTIYCAIAYITYFQIYRQSQCINRFNLTLNCNIVDFQNYFVAVHGIYDGKQLYFVFISIKGQIILVPVDNPYKQSQIKLDINDKISSIIVQNMNAYIGTEAGNIIKYDMNIKKIIKIFNTKTQLPILRLSFYQQDILIPQCNGQLHIINKQLQDHRFISLHYGMITMIRDDSCLRIVKNINKNIEEVRFIQYNKKINLLLVIGNKVYINFYEETQLLEILA